MHKLKMLVLTDHTHHSKENSLYPLVQAIRLHPLCAQVDVATKGHELNDFFFKKMIPKELFVQRVDEHFSFYPGGSAFKQNLRRENLRNYDVIWLRMPPPLSSGFLTFLNNEYSDHLIINDPKGIYETGSKEFLLNFPDLCPPMQGCYSMEDIIRFKNQFPIVLKPFREYGGKGIIRIDGDRVWEGTQEKTFQKLSQQLAGKQIEYLGVKFLKNVDMGDKRIIVVDGRIMGASLRLPAKDSWLCNVAMGGSSNPATITPEEEAIIKVIDPVLAKMGIVMYGIDTLAGDDGKRVLSEINTTSIGGLPQIAKMQGRPLVQEAAHLLWDYIKNRKKHVVNN